MGHNEMTQGKGEGSGDFLACDRRFLFTNSEPPTPAPHSGVAALDL
jgi:hypothetical protein